MLFKIEINMTKEIEMFKRTLKKVYNYLYGQKIKLSALNCVKNGKQSSYFPEKKLKSMEAIR